MQKSFGGMNLKILYGVVGIVVGFFIGIGLSSFFHRNVLNGQPISLGTSDIQAGTVATSTATDCTTQSVTETIQGSSMVGILKDGQQVTLIKNYYACHDVSRGDIVAYDMPGQNIVKKVLGMPGDSFDLKANGLNWNIILNGKVLTNAQGTPYALPGFKERMLAYYASSYNGTIPPGAYMILGNDPAGSADSTQFGLVNKQGFIGKVAL